MEISTLQLAQTAQLSLATDRKYVMAYTFTVDTSTLIVTIFNESTIVDISGPWESADAGSNWAVEFTSRLNDGLDTIETNVE